MLSTCMRYVRKASLYNWLLHELLWCPVHVQSSNQGRKCIYRTIISRHVPYPVLVITVSTTRGKYKQNVFFLRGIENIQVVVVKNAPKSLGKPFFYMWER